MLEYILSLGSLVGRLFTTVPNRERRYTKHPYKLFKNSVGQGKSAQTLLRQDAVATASSRRAFASAAAGYSVIGWGLAFLFAVAGSAWSDPASVRVMSFNLWHGGQAGGQPLEQSAAVIKAAKADIVGLQETHGENDTGNQTKALADLLGWNFLEQPDKTSVLTRFDIVRPLDDLGAEVELPDGKRVLVFNVHYFHAPYQPYQLLSIPYEDGRFIKTKDEAVDEARTARGGESDRLAAAIRRHRKGDTPIFVTGDFNEPSHLDWTSRAASAGVVPLAVEWPASKALADLGMTDAYRATRTDEAAFPGNTWTPTTTPDDPTDRHDRIDFVYVAGPLRIVDAAIVGESPKFAEIVVTPYPSDHRAVVIECEMVGTED